jgi:hypothetical protein
MNCKLALISWPVRTKDFYLVLGEIYDSKIKNDIQALIALYKEIQFLVPFIAEIDWKTHKYRSYIEADIVFFREKYKLTASSKLFVLKNTKNNPVTTLFKTPTLYDIT